MNHAIRLPRSSPEAQGISSAAILRLVEAFEEDDKTQLHSIMIVRHGHVVGEGWWTPYAPKHLHQLYSLSKSFASSAVGFAVTEGLLSVDEPVLKFFPEKAPARPNENLKAMTVKHLLSMNTGHDTDTTGRVTNKRDWVKAFLSLPVKHKPGSKFVYNTAATYMLSAIVQKLTGQTLIDYLTPRLFEPLGIENPTWETCPMGINTGGFGLSIRTEDIANFGQMYLQHGMWQGKQILPAEWVAEATAYHSDNSANENPDWAQGYGYQFWRSRHNAYRGDGAFGQYCMVLPEQDAVIAITAGTAEMQSVLDKIWKYLLPAFSPEPLPEDIEALTLLSAKLDCLEIREPVGLIESPLEAEVSGKEYTFEPNAMRLKSVKLDFMPNGAKITFVGGSKRRSVALGRGIYQFGETTLFSGWPYVFQPVKDAAAGVWLNESTYLAKIILYETPYIHTFTFEFSGDEVKVQGRVNVDMAGKTEWPEIVGKAA